MLFSSPTFLFLFLPIVLIGYYLLNKLGVRYSNVWLFLFSLLFFAWKQVPYVLLLLGSILVNYLTAIVISRGKHPKEALITGIVLNLIPLFVYKYYNFAVENFNRISPYDLKEIDLVLPIGISFYTFQAISYIVDVYRKTVEVQKNPLNFGLYLSLFPQLIAGPIVRYSDVSKEIEDRTVTTDGIYSGIRRFIIGLAKKVLIANRLSGIVDMIWQQGPACHSPAVAWIGAVSFALQIYYDFSGYSDMAIGLGSMMGFHFPENFNAPYCAGSISEFWRRWHITLSSWFRDYIYIPLGGNRRHQWLNLLIVFALTGIWHGAAWKFIVWGLYFFVLIIIEKRVFSKKPLKERSLPFKIFSHTYTLFFILLSWVIFRTHGLTDAVRYIGNMFGATDGKEAVVIFTNADTVTILAGILMASPFPDWLGKFKRSKAVEAMTFVLLLFLFVLTTGRVLADSATPFIYFQF